MALITEKISHMQQPPKLQEGIFLDDGLGRPARQKTAEEEFQEITKRTFSRVGGGIAGVSTLLLLVGILKSGKTFPARALQVVGDCFGSVAAVLAPFSIIGNEIKNYYLLKSDQNGNQHGSKGKGIFDDWREGFYRTCSIGFIPFIFEPFVNPEKFGKSIFHKIATVGNIPNLIFTGYSWGIGNLKALLAWSLRKREQIQAASSAGSKKEVHNKKAEEFNRIYLSAKRLAVIGSIANPTLQGFRQWADSMAFLTGSISKEEFFEKPFLGLSRLVSLFAGIPELFAKGVDSIVRVVKERENLRPVLPKYLETRIDSIAKWLEPRISNGESSTLRSIRHYAEIIFHTLSPLSMFALFTPLLDESHVSGEAQAQGGLTAQVNKAIGTYGKSLTVLFTGLYVTLARLPQAIFQISYFGRKLIGKVNKLFGGEDVSREDLENLKERICNSSVVDKLSTVAKRWIEKLVPDFYDREIENKHGYLTYEQIQANYGFDQVAETKDFKDLLLLVDELSGTQREEKQHKLNLIKAQIDSVVNNICLPYVELDAKQGKHILTSEEMGEIRLRIQEKITCALGLTSKPKRRPLPFIGADFIATYILKLFDLKSRLQAIDYRSSHHNMTTAYDNDEVRISFEYELLPVIAKCTRGLGNTINRLLGVAVLS